MSLKFFGTDGVRGKAFEPPLTTAEASNWGTAWAVAAKNFGIQKLVIGWDGRDSCMALLQAFLTGFGTDIQTELLGIVPTPAVSWVISRQNKAWGLVISASHNPPEDNGLKGFDTNGQKISEEIELAIEDTFMALTDENIGVQESHPAPDIEINPLAMEAYLANLGKIELPDSFPIIVDCAFGATAPWAQRVFTGAVHWIGTPSIGKKINVGVGSTHLGALRNQILSTGVAAGVAFDGDGDRCLILDNHGEIVDGDQMLWLLAKDTCEQGNKPSGVIGTVMSNGALEQNLSEMGIQLVRTPVGDKYMARELEKTGWDMAAEASGHLIQRYLCPTGDGIATALSVLNILTKKPEKHRWDWCFKPWPQKLVNIKTAIRKELSLCPTLLRTIEEIKNEFGKSIRLVIRWSGTEPLLRLMAEAQDNALVEQALDRLTTATRADLL
ncbi:MAG: hypothetical protein FWG02_06175 [Holophagaceae bacterium]|nr:hypothetical protein [Holophagaceae bacterium]